jgi:hypothetical protein
VRKRTKNDTTITTTNSGHWRRSRSRHHESAARTSRDKQRRNESQCADINLRRSNRVPDEKSSHRDRIDSIESHPRHPKRDRRLHTAATVSQQAAMFDERVEFDVARGTVEGRSDFDQTTSATWQQR